MSPAFPSLRDKHLQPDLQNNPALICFRSSSLFNQELELSGEKQSSAFTLSFPRSRPWRALPPPSQPSLAEHCTQVKQEQHNMEFC